MTIHICTICNRTLKCNDFDGACTMPKKIAMNCGMDIGTPFHAEEYTKAVLKEEAEKK